MSDTPIVVETYDNPSVNSPITSATADSFEQTLIARGVASADAKARADKYRPTQPDPQAPPATPPRRPTDWEVSDLSPSKLPNLTAGQIEGAKAHLIGHRGTLVVRAADTTLSRAERAQATDSLERVDATLRGMKYDPANPPQDTRTAGERNFDNSGLNAPTDPSGYDLNGVFGPDSGFTAADLPLASAMIREAMHEMSIPTALGKDVAGNIIKSMSDWSKLTSDEARETHHANMRATVQRVLKVSYEQVIDAIKPIVGKLGKDQSETLAASGAFESANTLISLYRAQRIGGHRAKLGRGNG